MQAFIDRVNATLPIKDPDYVLLTLLQTNRNKTCDGCRAGQTLTVGGSCVPRTIIAGAQRGSGSNGQGGADVLPWKREGAPQPAAQALLRPVGTTIVTTAPLSGRMAIGGPTQSPPPSVEDDNWPRSVAAVAIDRQNNTGVSQPSVTHRPAARPRRAIRNRKINRSKWRSRRLSPQRRNILLSFGGAY